MGKLTTYVALLRGINVGGQNLISMARLKACFQDLGLEDVRTYINSGNIIFRSDVRDPRSLEKTIDRMLAEQFNSSTYSVVKSGREMQAIVAHIPKSWQHQAGWRHNVMFLRHTVDKPGVVKQFAIKPDIEELSYFPGVLFWSADAAHLTKSTMLKVIRMPIYQEMTIRNENTTKKVAELMQRADKT